MYEVRVPADYLQDCDEVCIKTNEGYQFPVKNHMQTRLSTM